MLRPKFVLTQDDNVVYVELYVPYINLSTIDYSVEGTEFSFYGKPYFLKLAFPGLLSSSVKSGRFDTDSGKLKFSLIKANKGEYFEGLGMLTMLNNEKAHAKKLTPLIEVINSEENSDSESDDEPTITANTTPLLSAITYGFNNGYSDFFSVLRHEATQIIQLENPESVPPQQRTQIRIAAENEKFDAEYYMADFLHKDDLKDIMQFRPQWTDTFSILSARAKKAQPQKEESPIATSTALLEPAIATSTALLEPAMTGGERLSNLFGNLQITNQPNRIMVQEIGDTDVETEDSPQQISTQPQTEKEELDPYIFSPAVIQPLNKDVLPTTEIAQAPNTFTFSAPVQSVAATKKSPENAESASAVFAFAPPGQSKGDLPTESEVPKSESLFQFSALSSVPPRRIAAPTKNLLFSDDAPEKRRIVTTRTISTLPEIDPIERDKIDEEFVQWTDDENLSLMALPHKEYLITDENMVLYGLIDLLFAGAYDYRVNMGDSTCESYWNVATLSPTLSYLEIHSSLRDCVVACFRRSLAYPLYRTWELSMRTWTDVKQILFCGRKTILRMLLHIKKTLDKTLTHYYLSRLYIDDYCVWIQSLSHSTIHSLYLQCTKTKITKSLTQWPLPKLEHTAATSHFEEENLSLIHI
eukprot:TRINITY_DN11659_c0_g1_i1.p1 TRINITY_DN11659_c0_g1~~TRINITY_DN11659_c0_g1_i1.p1  ORF type:complete len:642 (-),score=97.02 TRINITY_DN11659_c0_g1_i1:37-1962(-)